MIPKTIVYHKTYNLGNYSSHKIGVEIEMEEGDDIQQVILFAKQETDKFHLDSIPKEEVIQRNEFQSGTTVKIIEQPIAAPASEPPNKMTQKEIDESTLQQITECTDPVVLETFKWVVKGKPKLQASYDDKLKSLNK